jgi:hypothetical protein
MAIDYLDEDYTITLYSYNKNQHKTLVAEYKTDDTVTENVVTQSVLNNYSWIEGTGSTYSDWSIVSGTEAIGVMNPNNSDATMSTAVIGLRNEIRGDEVFTNMYGGQSSERNRGIVVYKSSSVGYTLHDYINIPTASVAHSTSRTYLGREFSIDGEHLIVPIEKNYADSVDGELQIYKSSSSGWALAQTLTTASYNDNATVIADTGEYLAYWNSIVKNDLIFANGFTKTGGSKPARYVALFRSSSSGWEYEDQVQVSGFDIDDEPGNNNETGGRIGNTRLNFDFDGITGILGSKHANGSYTGYLNDDGDDSSGRIHVIKSGSSGWYRDAKLGLEGLGKTSNVDASLNIPTASGGETYPDWYTFQRFGLESCAVSGNYIAAAALSKAFSVGGSEYRWRKDSVFIMESGSTGWAIVAQLEDPDPSFVSSGSSGLRGDASFGYGLAFDTNSLMVNSPNWRPARSGDSGLEAGRCYVYHSTSAGGWALGQTINNPYSGSQFHTVTYERNEYLGGPQVPGGSGASHFGAKPALSGNVMVIPAPGFTMHPDPNSASTLTDSDPVINIAYIKGAVVVLSGSASYYQQEITEYTTESVTTKWVSSSNVGNPPFRLNTNTIQNIREQSPTNSYKTFIGEQKT